MREHHYHPGVQLLTCRSTTLGRWWNQQRFTAPYWRLYWNSRAGTDVVLAGREVALRPDRFVLIPPETPFTGHCGRPTPHLYLHFLAQAPYDAVAAGLYTVAADGLLRRLARRLATVEQVCRDGASVAEALGREPAMAALAIIHAALCELPEGALRPVCGDARIVRVLEAMERGGERVLGNEELAQLAGMSTNAFIRLFRTVTRQTPQAVYVRKRIGKTCMQLHFTDLSISEIAASAGFCDRYHFSRAFKRLRGVSPAAFRRQVGDRRRGE